MVWLFWSVLSMTGFDSIFHLSLNACICIIYIGLILLLLYNKLVLEFNELVPVKDFIDNYELIYGPSHVPFMKKTLEEAISECLFVPTELCRIVALYLHFDGSAFSQQWCKRLIHGETIANIIEKHFSILPWNLQDKWYHKILKAFLKKNHGILKASLKENLGISIDKYFTEQKSVVIFIVNERGKPTVLSVLENYVSEEDTLKKLHCIVKSFNNSLQTFKQCLERQRQQTLLGARGYHQFMFEMLGDRDYDCFEVNQHDELKKKIGFAMYGPPLSDEYDCKSKKQIDECYRVIRKQNNLYSEQNDRIVIAFVFNCLEPLKKEKESDKDTYQPLPIFVLKKCQHTKQMLPHSTCRIFIDHEFRVYNSWREYIDEIRLQECIMVLPKDGRYQGDYGDNVQLTKHLSPACKIKAKVLKVADVSTAVGGVASGGIALAATIPAITVGPALLAGAAVMGVGVGIYSMVRSSLVLHDRTKHEQAISITDAEVRGACINIAAGSLGTLGVGATAAVSQLAQRGINIGKGIQYTVNTINGLNLTMGATALGNSTYHIYHEWRDGQKISAWTCTQLGISVLFFGNAVYNFKTAGTVIEETQAKVLTEYRQGLRSNNHRKMFNKLYKETVRLNDGNKRAAHAEVISAVRKIPNKDELFAILHRNNKLFNKNGVRFSASGSEIKLNGQTVNLGHFGSLSKPERLQMVIDLPLKPSPQSSNVSSSNVSSSVNIKTSSVNIKTLLAQTNLLDLVIFGKRLVENCDSFSTTVQFLICEFKPTIQKKILEITKMFMNKLTSNKLDFICLFKCEMKNVTEPFIPLLKIVLVFIKNYAEDFREVYEARKTEAQKSPDYREEDFNKKYFLNPVTSVNTVTFIDKVVCMFTNESSQADYLLDQLLTYFMDMVAAKLIHAAEKVQNKVMWNSKKTLQVNCHVCGGFYFS